MINNEDLMLRLMGCRPEREEFVHVRLFKL